LVMTTSLANSLPFVRPLCFGGTPMSSVGIE
jgi:hypothetical protein